MSAFERKEVVFRACRCFNCLGNHLIRDCVEQSNCRRCQGTQLGKHFFMLHDAFVSTVLKASAICSGEENASNDSASPSYAVRCVNVGSTKAALNRIGAARVINPRNGDSTLVYCQLNGGSQLTFASEKLITELGIRSYGKASFRIDTLVGDSLTQAELVKLNVQSLFSNKMFSLNNVVTHVPWNDDEDTLPHRQDMSSYEHFKDVEMFDLPDNSSVDLLIGNYNAFLLTVLEEREGLSRSEPHAVLTPLGWLACGGVSPLQRLQ